MLNSFLTVVGAAEGASSATVKTVSEAMITSLQSAGSDLMLIVQNVVPVMMPVMISIAVVGLGIRVFHKLTGR